MYWHSPQKHSPRKRLSCTPLVTHSIRVAALPRRWSARPWFSPPPQRQASTRPWRAGTAPPRSSAGPCCRSRPTRPVRRAGPCPPAGRRQRHPVPVAVAAGRGLLGDRRRPPAGRVPGDARQRLRRQGQLARLPIRAYYVAPDFKTADGGTGTVTVGSRLHPVPRSRRPDRLHDRQRGHDRAAAHRRRHRSRSRCSADATATCGSATSSVRGSCTSTPRVVCSRRRSRCPVA